jgi:hypothetical protein
MAAGTCCLPASKAGFSCIKNDGGATLGLQCLSACKRLFMKKNVSAAFLPLLLLTISCLLSSCLKDECTKTYKIFTPVFTSLATLRKAVGNTPVSPVKMAGKLFIKDHWIFLNEQQKGIHVIDNSNPARPLKTAFINIPGNVDLYVKGNILYADLYSDLLAINITDPAKITVTKYLGNTFPEKVQYTASTNPDSINIITGWTGRDTVIDCNAVNRWYNCPSCSVIASGAQSDAFSSAKSNTGAAGSMARFAAVNDYLYAVTSSNLNVVDIHNAPNPVFIKKQAIGWDIETIFPYNNKLYIGAGSSMSVYDLQDPVNPSKLSWNGHWCSGDPVIADDRYAWVTLHEANVCGSKVNRLEIYDLSNPSSPFLATTYPLTHPMGLAKDDAYLFICDDGLKIFNTAGGVTSLKLIKQLAVPGAYDVIAQNGLAIVVAKDGIYQYDYSDISNIRFLSKL